MADLESVLDSPCPQYAVIGGAPYDLKVLHLSSIYFAEPASSRDQWPQPQRESFIPSL